MPGFVSSAKKPKRGPVLAGDNRRQLLISFIALIVVVIADQLTKLWAVSYLQAGEIKQVLGAFFQLKLAYNEGGAMGTNFGGGLFYLISSVLILAIVIYFIIISRQNKIMAYSLAAIAGGAIGNIIDRLRIGRVVDFLDFDFFDINLGKFRIERWWTFNIADSAIMIGLIILLICVIWFSPSYKSGESAPINNPTT
jgi:signal peptidase II